MKNIDIRNLGKIGVSNIDVYKSNRRKIIQAKYGGGKIQFFRSIFQMNGKLGIDDKKYSGTFGFDLYNSNINPKGSVIDYYDIKGEKITKKNYNEYICPYLSIWPPNSEKNKDTVILYVSVSPNDNSNIEEILEYNILEKDQDNFKKTTNALTITKGTEKDQNDKTVHKIIIKCVRSFENDITIEAKNQGNIIGRIIVKANANIYTTTIQPVVISFDDKVLLGTKEHDSFVKKLESFFNDNSFNQSYIKGTLAKNTHTLSLLKNEFLQKKILEEIESSQNQGGLFVNYTEDNQVNAKVYHNSIQDKYAAELAENKSKQKAKERLEAAMDQLINVFQDKFKYSHESDLRKAKRFYTDKIAYNVWNLAEVKKAYENYKNLKKNYTGDIFLDKTNKIYLFINLEIEGGRNPDSKAQAYSLPDSGTCHIFSSAYKDDASNSLITHELGHAFGCPHTFTDEVKKEIERNLETIGTLKNEKKELEKVLKSADLKDYYTLDNKYLTIQKLIDYNEKTNKPTISYFEKAFILNLTGECSFYENGKIVPRTATSVIDIETSNNPSSNISVEDEIKKREDRINELLAKNKNLEERVGIIAPQSTTLENLMDYRQRQGSDQLNPKFEYKMFYQSQWDKIIRTGLENEYISIKK